MKKRVCERMRAKEKVEMKEKEYECVMIVAERGKWSILCVVNGRVLTR